MGPPLRRKWTARITKAFSLIRPCIKKRAPGEEIVSPGARRGAFDKIAAYRWYKLLVWYWGSQVS